MSLSTSGGGGGKPFTLNGLVNAPWGPRKKFTRTPAFTPGGAGLWRWARITWPTGMVVVSWVARLPSGRSCITAVPVWPVPDGGTSWSLLRLAPNSVDVLVQGTVARRACASGPAWTPPGAPLRATLSTAAATAARPIDRRNSREGCGISPPSAPAHPVRDAIHQKVKRQYEPNVTGIW